ncbi:MAG TPA: hypothetical protein VFP15_13415 [Gemmatimonadaceae bacterium]|nr:hypothetical protein [Gemmatimonadaceae bacterium]
MSDSPSREPAPYKPTLFDREGAAAADTVRAVAYGFMVFGIATSAWMLNGGRLSLVVLGVFVVAGGAVAGVARALSGAAGAGWQRIMASGASTPYEEQFSYQDALVMRGQVAEALASYESIIAERPGDASARLRAAALYASRAGDPRRAAALVREVQHMPGVLAKDDIAASNRLIELLAGPLGEPGRAMVELRRLMDRHPGTDVAARAKLMLAELKATIASPEPPPGEPRR